MHRLLTWMLTLVALTIALPQGLAQHCGAYQTSTPDIVEGSLYVDLDDCKAGCALSVWVYQESNGIAGLQRHDGRRDDTCHGLIQSDQRLL